MNEDFDAFLEDFLAPQYPPRDNAGRPLLIPRGGGDRVSYTRASALGDVLEEFSFLWQWKMRGLAKGLSDRIDLVRLAAALPYSPGFVDDVQANRAAGRELDIVINRALDDAGVDSKADYGTAIHLRTEPGNTEQDPDEKQQADVQATWDLWARMGVVHLGTEIFTANDTLRSAGTFDNLSYVPGVGIVVTDKKTSAKTKQGYDIQLASYANSDVYNAETDQRCTLEEFVAAKGWDPALLRREVGLIWWIRNGKCEARWLDLNVGWEWAQIAGRILSERRPFAARVAKNVTGELLKGAADQRSSLLQALRVSPNPEQIWANPAAQAIWTDEHTEAATARRKELS